MWSVSLRFPQRSRVHAFSPLCTTCSFDPHLYIKMRASQRVNIRDCIIGTTECAYEASWRGMPAGAAWPSYAASESISAARRSMSYRAKVGQGDGRNCVPHCFRMIFFLWRGTAPSPGQGRCIPFFPHSYLWLHMGEPTESAVHKPLSFVYDL